MVEIPRKSTAYCGEYFSSSTFTARIIFMAYMTEQPAFGQAGRAFKLLLYRKKPRHRYHRN
jgi:hypothetical protein